MTNISEKTTGSCKDREYIVTEVCPHCEAEVEMECGRRRLQGVLPSLRQSADALRRLPASGGQVRGELRLQLRDRYLPS